MSSKYSFYEVVQIRTDRSALKKVDGNEGAVLGMAQNENGDWSYSVHVFDLELSCSLKETELLHTGRQMKREDFYDGESVKVEMNGNS